MRFTAKLFNHCVQIKIGLFALIKQINRNPGLRLIQRHLLHDTAGHGDFIFTYPAIRLGHIAHDRKQGSKKRSLDAFLVTRLTKHPVDSAPFQAFIKVVTNGRAE